MAREKVLVETFVTLADTLVDSFDVIDFLQVLSERCVDLLDVSAAGIVLADSDGGMRHAACSSEEMRLAELFELQVEEGPCFEAFRKQAPVTCGSPEDAARRWPNFAPAAAEHGFITMSAVPLRLRATALGALNMFSTDTGVLGDADIRVAQAMADVAAIGILQERAIRDATVLSAHLEAALDSRIVIEQAKGIVAEHEGISVDEAFERIRNFARAHNHLLSATARRILDATLPLNELASQSATRPSAAQ